MVAAHPFQPAELDVVLRKVARGEPLSRVEGQMVVDRVDELVDEPVPPEDAPVDDEPETPEEAAAVAAARADTRATVSREELKRRLGL